MAYVSDLMVHPDICRELFAAGLTDLVPFKWRIYPGLIHQIFCNQLDPDNYYLNAGKQLKVPGVSAPYEELACYTLTDMMGIIPNVWVSRNGIMWEVCGDASFQVEMKTAQHLPDACAMVVQEMLHHTYGTKKYETLVNHMNNVILTRVSLKN